MKALILAAGKGSRLSTIIKDVPKPMLLFNGKPILEHNINLCKRYGVIDFFINTSHLADVITNYFETGRKLGVNICYSFESELLGTSGALNNFKEQLSSDDFLVIYGDNFTNINIQELIKKHQQNEAMATIAFHYREDVCQSGVAELANDGRITTFIEKPAPNQTNSHWVNAGIYVINKDIFKFIPQGFSDFGKDIFPLLLKNNIPMYGVCFSNEVLAFDTPEMYYKNKK